MMNHNIFVSSWLEISFWYIGGFIMIFFSLLILSFMFLNRRRKNTTTVDRVVKIASEAIRIPLLEQIRSQLLQELGRARRYERPLSAAVLNFECEKRLDSSNRSLISTRTQKNSLQLMELTQFSFFLAGSLLRSVLRESDIIGYDAVHAEYILFLPESSKSKGLQAVYRLQEILNKKTQIKLYTGVAEFPGDALTVEELIECAREVCHRQLLDDDSLSIKEGIKDN